MRSISLLVFILYSLNTLAQDSYFTGKIVYEYTFLNPNTGQDITETMTEQMGAEQHYFINEHSYKSYDENGIFGQLYNSGNNKYYFAQGDQIMMIDASVTMDKVTEIIHLDETEIILGFECKKLIVKTENSETIYWYSPQLTIDYEIFSGHKFGEWADYLKASNGSIALKFIVENEYYSWISTATFIESMTFEKGDFDIENEIDSKN